MRTLRLRVGTRYTGALAVAALVQAAPPKTAVVGRVLGRWQRIGAALDAKAVADVADAEGRRQWERLPTEAMVAVQEYMTSDKLKEYMKSCGLEAWHSHFVKHTCVAHSTLTLKRTLPSRCQQATPVRRLRVCRS